MNNKPIITLEYFDGTPDALRELRRLWDEVFDDPVAFSDYYFSRVCADNRILMAYSANELVGMVHMNPYNLAVYERKALCYYIVGVAVRQDMRCQGIMRQMMNKALADMTSWGCPVTFLMPKRQEYYLGFGFRMVYETTTLTYDISGNNTSENSVNGNNTDGNNFRENNIIENIFRERISVYSLSQLVDDGRLNSLASEINNKLSQKYCTFALRDEEYLKHMLEEHRCQNGGVMVAEQEGLKMIFSYDIYGDTFYSDRVELFDINTGDALGYILSQASDMGCGKAVITLDNKLIHDGNTEIFGVVPDVEAGNGIMMLSLAENSDIHGEKLINNSFFDEIV